MIKAVIFDLDGTLADTMDDLRSAMNSMLRSFGMKERTRTELLKFINQGAKSFVKDSLPDDIEKTDELVDACLKVYLDFYSQCYDTDTYAYDGIKTALEALHNSGIKLGVLSNKNDTYVKAIITRLFGDDLFAIAEGYLDLPHKPDPSSALRMAKKMNVTPHECAFIGDSDTDINTAKNAGMIPIGVEWGYRPKEILIGAGANIILKTPDEITNLILAGYSNRLTNSL